MGYCGEAYFCAVGSKEGVFSDKEYINCQLHVLLKLDELHGYLDNALHCLLGIFPHHVTLHLQHQMTPNDFGGLHILRRDLAPWDASCAHYQLKSQLSMGRLASQTTPVLVLFHRSVAC